MMYEASLTESTGSNKKRVHFKYFVFMDCRKNASIKDLIKGLETVDQTYLISGANNNFPFSLEKPEFSTQFEEE